MEILLPNSLSKQVPLAVRLRSPGPVCGPFTRLAVPRIGPPVPFRDRDRSPGPTGRPPRSPGPRLRSLGPSHGPFAVPRSRLRSVCGPHVRVPASSFHCLTRSEARNAEAPIQRRKSLTQRSTLVGGCLDLVGGGTCRSKKPKISRFSAVAGRERRIATVGSVPVNEIWKSPYENGSHWPN